MTRQSKKTTRKSRQQRSRKLARRERKQEQLSFEKLEDRRLLAVISSWGAENTPIDSVGSNDGVLVSGTTYDTGQVGQAFRFDGIDDRVILADDPSLALTGSMTIEAWVRVDAFPTAGHGVVLFRGDDRGGLDPYVLTTKTDGQIEFSVNDGTSATNVRAAMPQGEFVYVAATLDDTTGEMSLYLNGVLMDQKVTTLRPFGALDPASNPGIGIGNHGGYPTTPHNFPFNGMIDELKVHDEAISAVDVLANFNSGKGSLFPSISIGDQTVVEGEATTRLVNDFVGSQSGGLDDPRGIAFGPDGDLFVAASNPAQILRYDGTTGAFEGIFANASDGVDPRTGGLLFNDGYVYVTTAKNSSVLRFDALTGVPAPATGQNGATFVAAGTGGLDRAFGLDFGSDGNLYVTSQLTDSVLRYDGTNGTFIDVFVASASGGLDSPNDLRFGPDGNLFVASTATDEVLRFEGPDSANPGAFIDAFVSAQSGGLDAPPSAGLAFGTDGDLYVSSRNTNRVLRFDGTSGTFMQSIGGVITGTLSGPKGIAFDSNGRLYVASGNTNNVLRSTELSDAVLSVQLSSPNPNVVTVEYATTNGTATSGSDYVATSGTITFQPGETYKPIFVPIIDDSFVEPEETFGVVLSNSANATIGNSAGTVTIVERRITIDDVSVIEGDQSPHFRGAFASVGINGGTFNTLTFGPDGNLYASIGQAASNNQSVMRYDGTTGNFIGVFVSGTQFNTTRDLLFRDGKLFVADLDSDEVKIFDDTTGAPLGAFVTAGSGGLIGPEGLVFGPDGNLYVTGWRSNNVIRYDGQTGAFIDTFISGLNAPTGIAYSNGEFFVTHQNDEIRRYDVNGTFLGAIGSSAEGLSNPLDIAVGPDDGLLYVTSGNTSRIMRYDLTSGNYVDDYVPAGTGGLNYTRSLVFNNGDLYVSSINNGEILSFGTKQEAVFTVNLSVSNSFPPVTVDFATSSDTAVAGIDYTSVNGTLTFDPGVTQKAVIIPIIDDTIQEPTESFFVNLSNASGAQIQDNQGIATIIDVEFTDTVVFSDSFEVGEWNGLWVEDSQNDWRRRTQRATDGSWSAEVDGRATNATLTVANAIDMSAYGSAELSFDWLIESGFDSGEYLRLDFWDGSSWNEILSLDGNVDQENTWFNEVVQLDSQYLNADFKFRFRAKASRSNEDANVDNVQLLATSLAVPPNAAPTAVADAYNVNEDNTLVVSVGAGLLINDSDPDNDPITALLVNGPANGSITLNSDGSFSYTPNPDFNGNDSFTYRAFDGIDTGNIATVSIAVNQIDDLGSFGGNLAQTTDEDTLASGTATFTDAADGYLTPNFGVTTSAINGAATIDANGNWNYTPSLNFNGSDSFTVSVTDDDGNVQSQLISITITPVADLTANDDNVNVDEDGTLNGDVSANDSTTSGGSLSFAINSGPTTGSLTLNPDGSFSYSPNGDFNGSDSFTYTVTDSVTNETATQTVNIAVNQVNDPGSFGGSLAAVIDEDAATAGIATFADAIDGYAVGNFIVGGAATNGLATIDPNGNWSYTPNANFNGNDSFIVSVTDDDGNVETQTIDITITPVVDLTAINDNFNTNEDGLLVGDVSTNDSTTSSGTLGFTVDSSPGSGSLTLNPDGSFSYTPNTNFNGNDSFSYTVTDTSANESDTRTVSITIDQVNDAGLFGGDLTATIDENATASGTVTFSDAADGFSAANFVLGSPATNGVASIDSVGNWSYTPVVAFFGVDSFTVSVTDDDGNVETQAISVTVNEVTQLTANDDFYSVDEDGSLGGDVSANDSTTSGGTLSFILASGPSSGLLSVFNSDGSFTYTPNADVNGSDSFTYAVTDPGSGETDTRTVSITVNQINDPGLFGGNLTATTNEDVVTGGTVSFTDSADGDSTPNFAISSVASNGIASVDSNGNWSYAPDANYNGIDSFELSVIDDDGNLETQVVNVTIAPVTDLAASNDGFNGSEDTVLAGNVGSNDSTTSGGTLSFSVDSGPASGSLGLNSDGSFSYAPNLDFNGNDSFTYTVTDADANESDTRTVNITVNQVNDPGLFGGNLSETTNEDSSIGGAATFTDVADGFTSANFTINGAASSGVASIDASGNWTYSPNANFNGSDSFSVSVTDDDGNLETQVVNVTITPVGDLTASDDGFSGTEDTALAGNVATNDSTTSGGTLSFAVNSSPTSGSLTLNSDGTFSYSPNANFNGNDSFIYTVNDATAAESDTRTVSITINAVNDAPVAVADTGYSLDQDTTLNISAPGVLANDTDIDGDSLAAVWVSDPANGSLMLNADGSFDYTPAPGFFGNDSFTYVANDGTLDSNQVTVSITVNEVVVNSGPNLAFGVVDNVGSSGWTVVNLPYTYTSMVVIASANYSNTSGPGVVRIQNATGSSFEVMVQSPGGGTIGNVDVNYTVMEEGIYDEPGYKLEAVKYDSTVTDQNNAWNGESRSYQQSYSAPVVVGQVMSYNDSDWSVFWAAGSSRTSAPSSSALTVGKHVGEDSDVTRASETIGYFVIETTTTGVIEGFPIAAGVGSDSVRGMDNVSSSNGYQYNYGISFNAKAAVVSQAGMDGGDGGWAVLYGSDPVAPFSSLINVAVDEDQIGNSERKHTTEQIAYFVIDPPVVDSNSLMADAGDEGVAGIIGPELSRYFFASAPDRATGQSLGNDRDLAVKSQVPKDSDETTELSLSFDQFFEQPSTWTNDVEFDGDRVDLSPRDGSELDSTRLDDLFGAESFEWSL